MSSKPFIGVATPQANPTVEMEMRALLARTAIPLATRLTSGGATPRERLIEYIEQIDVAIDSFDTLKLAAFAFACTGSSYLVGRRRESELAERASQAHGLPVITATAAIAEELVLRGASTLAILAPYPQSLIDASLAYWSDAGAEVLACERIDIGDDTRAIYELTAETVDAAVDHFDARGADISLLSGTGMPTIDTLLKADTSIISSNLCLAGSVLRRAGLWPDDQPVDVKDLVHDA